MSFKKFFPPDGWFPFGKVKLYSEFHSRDIFMLPHLWMRLYWFQIKQLFQILFKFVDLTVKRLNNLPAVSSPLTKSDKTCQKLLLIWEEQVWSKIVDFTAQAFWASCLLQKSLRRLLFVQIWLKVRCEFLCTSMKIQVQPATLAKFRKIIDSFWLWASSSTKMKLF